MKKNIAVSAVALLLATTGCQNTDIAEAPLTREFRVEVSVGDASRTHIDENGTMTWSDGDQIYVGNLSDGTTGGVLTLVSGAGSPNAVFAGIVTGSGELQYSVFPVPGQDGKIDLTTRKANQPNVPLISTFEPGKPGELSFDKTCGVVRLELNNEEKVGNELSLNTKDTNQPNLGGTAEIVFDEVTKRYKLEYTRGTGGVTITDLPDKGTILIPVITTAVKTDENGIKQEDNINPDNEIELTLKVDESETDFEAKVKEGAVTEEGVPDIEINEDGEIETTPDSDEPEIDDTPVITIENESISNALFNVYGDEVVTINENGFAEIKKSFMQEIDMLRFFKVDEISFKDIEKLEYLSIIAVESTGLEELHIPALSNVYELLILRNSNLSSLSFTENTSIKSIILEENGMLPSLHLDELAGLDNVEVRKNAVLREITFPDGNEITGISISENSELTELNLTCCSESLEHLIIDRNAKLASLDISGLTGLKWLTFPENGLTSLNASDCTSLSGIEWGENPLTDLNLSGCTSLKSFCTENSILHLNLSGCESLAAVELRAIGLESLDLSECPALESVYCYGNRLTELNLTDSPNLIEVFCGQQKDENDNSILLKLKLNASESVQAMWNSYKDFDKNQNVELDIEKDWEQGEGNTGASNFGNGGYY